MRDISTITRISRTNETTRVLIIVFADEREIG